MKVTQLHLTFSFPLSLIWLLYFRSFMFTPPSLFFFLQFTKSASRLKYVGLTIRWITHFSTTQNTQKKKKKKEKERRTRGPHSRGIELRPILRFFSPLFLRHEKHCSCTSRHLLLLSFFCLYSIYTYTEVDRDAAIQALLFFFFFPCCSTEHLWSLLVSSTLLIPTTAYS